MVRCHSYVETVASGKKLCLTAYRARMQRQELLGRLTETILTVLIDMTEHTRRVDAEERIDSMGPWKLCLYGEILTGM